MPIAASPLLKPSERHSTNLAFVAIHLHSTHTEETIIALVKGGKTIKIAKRGLFLRIFPILISLVVFPVQDDLRNLF